MLEQLFGSKTRLKLLRLFLQNQDEPYFLRQLARLAGAQLNSVRREIENLEKIGIIKAIEIADPQYKDKKTDKKKKKPQMKKHFIADKEFILFNELKSLLLKAQVLLERKFVSKIETLSGVGLFMLTGLFVGREGGLTDMLVVGTFNKQKLASIVKAFEKDLNQPINYTVMTQAEYKYRKDITDRFLYDILESKNIMIVDKITKKT
jgi:DNA-binding Lrp family transcriptional regulator